MIMPCMNCTSAVESGGSVALVEAGSVRVGWPGAPGCTTTGVVGSACCAQTGSENKPKRILPAISQLGHAETFITDRELTLTLSLKSFELTCMVKNCGGPLYHKAALGSLGFRPAICAVSSVNTTLPNIAIYLPPTIERCIRFPHRLWVVCQNN
jgi:hypothetical protein